MSKLWPILVIFLIACSHESRRHEKHDHHHDQHRPGHMNDKYLDPNLDASQKNIDFEASDRDVIVFKEKIIRHLPLKRGHTVADVGAGTGIFESLLSEKVGKKGKVYAIDIAPSFIPFMKERFQKEKLLNVEVILSKLDTTTLKDNSVDLVFVADTYHHFDHAQLMLQDFLRILKPKGYLVIVDFMKNPGAREWIQMHIKKTKEEYIQEISDAGLDFVREERIPFKESFQLTFQKN